MKKLSIIFAVVMVLGVVSAMAAPNYQMDDASVAGKLLATTFSIPPGSNITLDVYLADANASQVAGGAWIDFTGSVALIQYVSAGRALTDGSEGVTGPWQVGAGVLVNEPAGPGTLMYVVANLGGAVPDADGDLIVGRIVLKCLGAGNANVAITTIPSVATWAPIADGTVVPGAVTIQQVVECTVDADCTPAIGHLNDGLWCTGYSKCEANICVDYNVAPCNDTDVCTTDVCTEAPTPGDTTDGTCDNTGCAATSGIDPCCLETVCIGSPVCEACVTITVEPTWAAPGDVGVKVDLCLDNRTTDKCSPNEVGGIQVDICDEPDCLTCVGCELTERTVIFDCVVLEQPDGCCRVILFSKHPGGVINPGICSVVKIDYVLCDETDPDCPAECNAQDCIVLTPEGIKIADQYGYAIASTGIAGEVCPFECGDVYPPESTPGAKDCGDGVVDIFDILAEVDFALGAVVPDACQLIRGDVPTGTPPYCQDPNGVIDIFDVMVIIDMALNRQDCCSYYYMGIIY